MFLGKCSKSGADHLDQGVFARKAHKKHVFTYGAVWIGYGTSVGNPLACFQPSLLDDYLVFCFQSKVAGQISTLILEPSFLSNVAELTYAYPEFKQFLLRVHGSGAMFWVVTVYGVDLLYHTLGIGH